MGAESLGLNGPAAVQGVSGVAGLGPAFLDRGAGGAGLECRNESRRS